MIAIYEDHGGEYDPDDYVPTALYDDGRWIAGGDDWAVYYPPGTAEAVIAEQLDGPSAVAVTVTEGVGDLVDRIEKRGTGPPMSSTLGVGDRVSDDPTVDEAGDPDEEDASE